MKSIQTITNKLNSNSKEPIPMTKLSKFFTWLKEPQFNVWHMLMVGAMTNLAYAVSKMVSQ